MITKELGNNGEEAVAQFLQEHGYTILASQFSCKYGEVDVIAHKDDVIAFVEVKTRRTAYFPIANVVTLSKQRKIIAAAKYYILTQRIDNKVYRFDIATVIPHENTFGIDYLEDAFRTR